MGVADDATSMTIFNHISLIQDKIITTIPNAKGTIFCPIILGSNKTMVSVATGYVKYHLLYLSIGNPYNTVWHSHHNAVIPIAFLTIPKCTVCHCYLAPVSGIT
jgi:hypothetical protein